MKTPNQRLRYEREIRGWSQQKLAREIGTSEDMVSRWEAGARPGKQFQGKLCELFGKNAIELGFLSSPLHVENTEAHTLKNISLSSKEDISSLSQMIAQQIIQSINNLQFFDRAEISQPAYSSLSDQFVYALEKPSSTDLSMIGYFEARLDSYWRDRHSVKFSSIDLLRIVVEDFQRIITLLNGSLFPTLRIRLCKIGSATAQLIGHLLFDLGDLKNAIKFQNAAIKAAQEAEDPLLEAIARVRMSYIWTSLGNAEKAVTYTQEARQLASATENQTIRAYLGALDAHAQAILRNKNACLVTLDMATSATQKAEHQKYSRVENYWLNFNQSRLLEYQGACFRKLYNPNDKQTDSFLPLAQKALNDALTQLSPALLQRKSALHIHIAKTYVLQNNIEGACEYAIQAITIISQTKSQASLQRLISLRQELTAWQDTEAVKNLDKCASALFMTKS